MEDDQFLAALYHALMQRRLANDFSAKTLDVVSDDTELLLRVHGASELATVTLNREIASRDHVVRHRCQNRLCINPDHLALGTQADNKRDDWEHWANGIDFDYL